MNCIRDARGKAQFLEKPLARAGFACYQGSARRCLPATVVSPRKDAKKAAQQAPKRDQNKTRGSCVYRYIYKRAGYREKEGGVLYMMDSPRRWGWTGTVGTWRRPCRRTPFSQLVSLTFPQVIMLNRILYLPPLLFYLTGHTRAVVYRRTLYLYSMCVRCDATAREL